MFAKKFECSICGDDAGDCDHAPGAMYPAGRCMWEYDDVIEVDEWSFVYSGAVKGTGFYLAAENKHPEARDVEAIERELAERPIAAWFAKRERELAAGASEFWKRMRQAEQETF
jgi:hypothetical protein